MSLITVVLALLIVGIVLWLLNSYCASFIDPKILKIINVLVVVVVIIWLLGLLGLWDRLGTIQIRKL